MRRGVWLAYLGGSLATGVFNAFNNITLPLWLNGLTGSLLLIAVLGNARSFESALVAPFVGSWSDRLWLGWLGRRRPFLLAGGLLAATIVAATPSLTRGAPEENRLLVAVGAVVLFTLCFNLQDDIHRALLVDLTKPIERSRFSGIAVGTEFTGQVVLLALAVALTGGGTVPDSVFYGAAGLMAAGILLTVLGVREPEPALWHAQRIGSDRPTVERRSPTEPLAIGPIALLRASPAAGIYCLAIFAYWAGLNSVLPLVSIFNRTVLGATPAQAQGLPALLLLGTALLAFPMGLLANRIGKRQVLGLGFAIMAVGAICGLFVTTVELGAVIYALAGIGNAATVVMMVPLLADLVPPRHIGLAAGVMAASQALSAPVAGLLAGTLSEIYGLRAIFALLAIGAITAIGLLAAVRVPSGEPSILGKESQALRSGD